MESDILSADASDTCKSRGKWNGKVVKDDSLDEALRDAPSLLQESYKQIKIEIKMQKTGED